MKTAQVSDVTQEEFDSAVQTVVSGIKASDPKLDTRIGTVLRSLLINPEARITATVTKQFEYARKASSLKTLKESDDEGEEIDVNDVSAVMSNFNLKSINGTYADGIVKISVTDGDQSYTVSEGSEFTTIENLKFTATSDVTAVAAGSTLKVSATTVLYKGSSSYFFLVPVKASEIGAAYNIQQGTSLDPDVSIYTFISAEAYKTFDGGSDVADLKTTIDNIPSGLSIRGFVNKSACEGMLRDNFDGGNFPILACSTVGYGNSAQRRDKHSVFGVGIGGRVDLYVRNFGDLYTITDTVRGHRDQISGSDSVSYTIDITPDKFPGSCWVKSVSSIYDVNSTLGFECSRTADAVSSTWHDIDVRNDNSEAFNTVWQGLKVRALEVPPDIAISDSSSSNDDWSEYRDFRVTVYCLPEAKKLQDYVDRDDVRSVSTDVVVRCPVICNVTVSAVVVYDPSNPIDESSAKYKIRKYINSLGFVKALTRSEIVHILKGCGAVSVDLSRKDMLFGTLHDAYGKEYNLKGDSLQLESVTSDYDAMVTPDTTVFAVEQENIQLTLIPNE